MMATKRIQYVSCARSYTLVRSSEFVINHRYKNLKPVGRGAYGLVASAFDTITGREVGIVLADEKGSHAHF